MAETIPSNLIISDVSITNEHRTYTTESMTGKFVSRDSGVQRFRGTLTLTAEDTFRGAQALNGFLAKLKGRLNEFEISLGGAYASDTYDGLATVQSTTAIGSSSINLGGLVGSVHVGQVFNCPNDTKLYTCLTDITNSGVIQIVPEIRTTLNISDVLDFKTPKFTAILDSSESTIQHTENGLISSATLNWVESL